MLLTRRLAALYRLPERGAALAAVLGLMAIFLVFASLITASVVGAYGVSSATRSGVQSGAAADAGIAAARKGLYTPGNCAAQPTPGTYASAVAPKYNAKVEYFAGSVWTAGCPIGTPSQVRITSRGIAQSPGINGATAGDVTKVEAVLKWVLPGIDPSGVALYWYKGGSVESNSSFNLTGSPVAGIMSKNGNFDCSKNNSELNGSVLISGNLTFTGSCTINGSAWVSGTATLGSGKIRDNLTAGTVSPNPPGSQVGGIFTRSSVIPTVPPWTEIGYAPADWVDPSGTPYEVKTACSLPDGNLGGTIAGAPVIIDARGCAAGPTVSNNSTVKLTSDVVIFANKFDFSAVNSLQFSSSTTAVHRLWFITPDTVSDVAPTCAGTQGDFVVKNGFSINDPIEALLYTPCAFAPVNNFTWRGQILAGNYSSAKNNPAFTFIAVGLPGANLTTGETAVPVRTPQPGAVVSNREVTP